ncbi:MAG: MFS transporter [Roseomonas sp.]|nr:MFS transporter [Roseomonas sp.]MCA3346940.1 MFS transporter [Roseomonas sp.]MCA3386666.1 MFS transporter [Roseomonas sp.]MCA3394966.1 MFS transporter [Roseomonas sp.]MCA3399778.1 MFS transporter [Roseomonas sp.]
MTAPEESAAAEQAKMRRVLAIFGPAVFAGAFATRVTDPTVAEIASEFSVTAAEAALLGTAYTLPFALVQPILGPVADSVGKRRIVMICVALLGVMLLAAAVSASFGWLMAFRAASGMAAGGMMPLTLAIMGDAVSLKYRQVALSRILIFGIGGQIAGGVVAGPIAALAGWRGVLVVCAIAAFLGLVALILAARGAAREVMTRYDPVVALQRYRGIIANPAALPLFAAVAIEGGLVFGTFPFIAPLLIERGIGSTMEAGFAIGAFGIGGLVFAALVAPLLARFGQAGVIRIGGATAALALAGFALAPSLMIATLAGLGLGLGFYMIHNAIQTRATELAPQARASAMSLHAFAFFGGQSLGPIFYGLGDMIFGLPATLGLAAGGIMVLALLLARR